MASPLDPNAPAAPSARRKFLRPRRRRHRRPRAHSGWCARWLYAHSHETTDDAQVDGHIVPVIAKVGGYVAAVRVGDNDSVHAGQLLVRLDSAEYAVRLAQAEADLAAARATAGSRNGVGQAGAAVQTAAGQRSALDAQIDAAKANLTKAQADLARLQVARRQADRERAAARRARRRRPTPRPRRCRRSSGRRPPRAPASPAPRRACASPTRASAAMQAARDNAALQLSYTTIIAPASRHRREEARRDRPARAAGPAADVRSSPTPASGSPRTSRRRSSPTCASARRWTSAIDAYGGVVAEGEVESFSRATGARFALLPPDNATGNFTKVVQRIPVRIKVTKGLGPAQPAPPGHERRRLA